LKTICLDTSILFSVFEPDWRGTVTNLRLNEISKIEKYVLVSADAVVEELNTDFKFGPAALKYYGKWVKKTYKTSFESLALSKEYIREVRDRLDVSVPRADAAIISISTLNELDYILTWNFEHLDNAAVMGIVKEINAKKKFKTPLITNPKDFMP
jgi:hypothetical protein